VRPAAAAPPRRPEQVEQQRDFAAFFTSIADFVPIPIVPLRLTLQRQSGFAALDLDGVALEEI
jgi:hypothetical protein